MLGSLLSDPESMQQIMELAQMMGSDALSSDDKASDKSSEQKSSDSGPDLSFIGSMLGQMTGSSSDSGGLSFDMIAKLMQVMGSMGSNDKDSALLLALKPHLSEEKQRRIDKAVRLIKIYSVINSLKDSGMLSEL